MKAEVQPYLVPGTVPQILPIIFITFRVYFDWRFVGRRRRRTVRRPSRYVTGVADRRPNLIFNL